MRRFAGDPPPDPLADNRETSTFIYKYNGKNLTSERLPNGKVNMLTGRLGKPQGILPLLRERAGNSVHSEQFANDQPQFLNVQVSQEECSHASTHFIVVRPIAI
jgi:hypothetical protein